MRSVLLIIAMAIEDISHTDWADELMPQLSALFILFIVMDIVELIKHNNQIHQKTRR